MGTVIDSEVNASLKISINTNTLKWLNLIHRLGESKKFDKIVRMMYLHAFGQLHKLPPRYLTKAVKCKDVTTMTDWANKVDTYCTYTTFVNKMILGRNTSIKTRIGSELENIPLVFRYCRGVRVLVLRSNHTLEWMNKHLYCAGHKNIADLNSGIFAVGQVKGKPFYIDVNGQEIVKESKPNLAEEAELSGQQRVSYTGRMKDAVPVWKPTPPPYQGMYIAACFGEEKRDVLMRGTTPDSHTKVEGQAPGSRLSDNLYIWEPNDENTKGTWQHSSGFYDGAITHYLDFEVEYE